MYLAFLTIADESMTLNIKTHYERTDITDSFQLFLFLFSPKETSNLPQTTADPSGS
jgi:hypothetical protein